MQWLQSFLRGKQWENFIKLILYQSDLGGESQSKLELFHSPQGDSNGVIDDELTLHTALIVCELSQQDWNCLLISNFSQFSHLNGAIFDSANYKDSLSEPGQENKIFVILIFIPGVLGISTYFEAYEYFRSFFW